MAVGVNAVPAVAYDRVRMTKMRAYHNSPALKDRVLAQVRAHREADQIRQGRYWEQGYDGVFRGCAVGCLLHDPEGGHQRYEDEFGIEARLAWLQDAIFESLPVRRAVAWPERFLDAIPVGADLSMVWPRFAIWLMADEKWGVANHAHHARAKNACWRVADGYRRMVDGDPLSSEDAEELAWDAWDAGLPARDAARDAWIAGYAWDARDAGLPARDAWIARDEGIAPDARGGFALAGSDKLIGLLGAA